MEENQKRLQEEIESVEDFVNVENFTNENTKRNRTKSKK